MDSVTYPQHKPPPQGAFFLHVHRHHMRCKKAVCISYGILTTLLLFVTTPLVYAADDLMDSGRATSIDYILDTAISRRLIAGGVVLVGNRDGVIHTSSRGRAGMSPEAPLLSERTVFDIASLTKVIATAPAVMKLLEEGRINLLDPITRWFPEMEGTGRENITILNLLTHTSGLNDIQLADREDMGTVIRKAMLQKESKLPGSRFLYADINFMLLGELVQRVSGMPLDRFCRERIHGPLGMGDTMFLPPREPGGGIASTISHGNELAAGIVQDSNALRLGGVAGHAGLFSTASDLSRFATMILNKGKMYEKSIFSERVLAQMTAPYFYSNGMVVRGLGWDIYSPYSAPRGSLFSEMSFGHTGYSGTSLWIDPERNLFVILLTVRLEYRDIRHFNSLRSAVSTISASIFSQPPDVGSLIEN